MLGRFWTTQQLRLVGWDRAAIRAALHGGRSTFVRRGHYADSTVPQVLVRAARVGGVATATSAGASFGLWTGPDDLLHVALQHGASRLRDPDDPDRSLAEGSAVCLHWDERGGAADRSRSRRADPVHFLADAFSCREPDLALALVDSALHARVLRTDALPLVAGRLPVRLRALVDEAEESAESGLETVARVRLRRAGLRVQPQVTVPGVGRVDLLVEGRLIIELDGRAHHGGPEQFARDRARDLAAAADRYRVLRFTWHQVLFDWPAVEAAVFAALDS